MTLNELLDLVREYPYGSSHHREITELITTHHNKKYRNQYILCTKGLYEREALFKTSDETNTLYSKVRNELDKISPLEADAPFYYVERNQCEHNPQHRQIIVNTIVVDEKYERVIVLQDGKGYVSLIGGHVDFNKHDYHRTITEILNFNMRKELNEEVGESEYIKLALPRTPTYVLSSNGKKGSYYDMTHLIMLYITVLPTKEFDKQIKSMKETEKYNTPVVLELDTVMRKTRKNSVRLAVELINRRKHRNSYNEAAATSE